MLKFKTINIIFLLIGVIIAALGMMAVNYWWLILSVVVLVYCTLLFQGVVLVKWQFFMPITCEFSNNENQVILSFDDGPTAQTSSILDILKKHHVKANFFCIGKHLDNNPELAQRLVDEGHFIGNHSYSHTPVFPLKSAESTIKELQQTNTLIEKLTHKACCFFRPPFGVTNPTIAKAVAELNMHSIGWSIRSFDTSDQLGTKALEKIKKNLTSGDIILMHDHSPQILYILEELLNYMKKNQFIAQRIDTLWELSEPKLSN